MDCTPPSAPQNTKKKNQKPNPKQTQNNPRKTHKKHILQQNQSKQNPPNKTEIHFPKLS